MLYLYREFVTLFKLEIIQNNILLLISIGNGYKIYVLENGVYDNKVEIKDISEILKVSVFVHSKGQFTQPPTVIVD
jgi:hypothetical protein